MASKNICPLINKKCIENNCVWWCTVRGYDINTGREVDEQRCAISLLPMLMIENSGQQRGTGAAVESLRNEMAKRADATNNILANMVLAPSVRELPSQPNVQDLLPPSDSDY